MIVNNNGIYSGIDQSEYQDSVQESTEMKAHPKLPSTSYLPNTHYEKMAEMVGGKGWFVTNEDDLTGALDQALKSGSSKSLNILNVMIEPSSTRKAQVKISFNILSYR